ncbi:hypothetical protein GCM10010449_84420 [Streptomyces rectiviolaceus]|uniref:Uncharacterized protein n=1 Tax=Streptomyces rectiviolaceus TaxID=332591 RepID=A0ABP6NPN3_9ACTN
MNSYLIACYGKARFPSRSAARRRARQIRGTGGPAFTNYRCRWCRHVHLAHRPGQATHLRAGPHGPIPVQEYAA